MPNRLVIGISGASGAIYAIRLLEVLKQHTSLETHLMISQAAEQTIEIETDYSVKQVSDMASARHSISDLAAPVSSGSFLTKGMVVIPCSMKSLSGIVNCYNDNLLVRSADVTLKENRKLILVPRETPLHKAHLELMLRFVDNGGILIPPFPAFYHSPETIIDLVDQTVGKVLDQLQIEHSLFKRWQS